MTNRTTPSQLRLYVFWLSDAFISFYIYSVLWTFLFFFR